MTNKKIILHTSNSNNNYLLVKKQGEIKIVEGGGYEEPFDTIHDEMTQRIESLNSSLGDLFNSVTTLSGSISDITDLVNNSDYYEFKSDTEEAISDINSSISDIYDYDSDTNKKKIYANIIDDDGNGLKIGVGLNDREWGLSKINIDGNTVDVSARTCNLNIFNDIFLSGNKTTISGGQSEVLCYSNAIRGTELHLLSKRIGIGRYSYLPSSDYDLQISENNIEVSLYSGATGTIKIGTSAGGTEYDASGIKLTGSVYLNGSLLTASPAAATISGIVSQSGIITINTNSGSTISGSIGLSGKNITIDGSLISIHAGSNIVNIQSGSGYSIQGGGFDIYSSLTVYKGVYISGNISFRNLSVATSGDISGDIGILIIGSNNMVKRISLSTLKSLLENTAI